MTIQTDDIDWDKSAGLVPAIVQHANTARVLMLGYMNPEAFEQTLSSSWVTFYSRSRQCLWTKGETSGNRLALQRIELDCDGDTLLVQALPGVESVVVGKFERLGEGGQGEKEAGVLLLGPLEVARLDNDPSYPENGRLSLEIGGGR